MIQANLLLETREYSRRQRLRPLQATRRPPVRRRGGRRRRARTAAGRARGCCCGWNRRWLSRPRHRCGRLGSSAAGKAAEWDPPGAAARSCPNRPRPILMRRQRQLLHNRYVSLVSKNPRARLTSALKFLEVLRVSVREPLTVDYQETIISFMNGFVS